MEREVDIPLVTNPIIRAQLDKMYEGFRKHQKKKTGQCICGRCRGTFYKEGMQQVNSETVAPQHRRYMCLACVERAKRGAL